MSVEVRPLILSSAASLRRGVASGTFAKVEVITFGSPSIDANDHGVAIAMLHHGFFNQGESSSRFM